MAASAPLVPREEQTHDDRGRRARHHRTRGPPCRARAARRAEGLSGRLLGEYENRLRPADLLVRRPTARSIQISRLLYLVDLPDRRVPATRPPSRPLVGGRARPGTERRSGALSHHGQAGCLSASSPAEGAPAAAPTANPLLALRARVTLLPRRAAYAAGTFLRPLFRWPVVAAVAGSFAGRGLLAAHRARAGQRASAGRCTTRWTCCIVLGLSVLSAAVPRVRARGRLPLRRRAARRDRRGHLPGLARVLHQRHRLLPAQPRRAAAHRPRRPVLQPDLHAGPGRGPTRPPRPRSCSSS